MDTETLKQLMEILGTASGDVRSMLWAFVVKAYLEMFADWALGVFFLFCGWRIAKFVAAKEPWKYM